MLLPLTGSSDTCIEWVVSSPRIHLTQWLSGGGLDHDLNSLVSLSHRFLVCSVFFLVVRMEVTPPKLLYLRAEIRHLAVLSERYFCWV